MKNKKIEKKLVTCQATEADYENLKQEMQEGWHIINVIPNGNNYLCILEKGTHTLNDNSQPVVFIPPRKKIRFTHKPNN